MSSLYDYDCLYGLDPPVYIDTGGGLGLYRVGLKRKETTCLAAKLAIHRTESPIWTQGKTFYLVSSQPISPAHVHSPDARGPPNPGLPQ